MKNSIKILENTLSCKKHICTILTNFKPAKNLFESENKI